MEHKAKVDGKRFAYLATALAELRADAVAACARPVAALMQACIAAEQAKRHDVIDKEMNHECC